MRGWARAGAVFTTNATPVHRASLNRFRERLMGYWWHALARRSQRGRLTSDRKQQLAARYIPLPVILHPYPQVRFDAKHPSPSERKPTGRMR